MAKGITKTSDFYKSQKPKGGVKPIVREHWNSDDLAKKALAQESKKRPGPGQSRKGTFDPRSNKKQG